MGFSCGRGCWLGAAGPGPCLFGFGRMKNWTRICFFPCGSRGGSPLPLKQCPFDFTEEPPSRSALPQRLVACSRRVPGVFLACSGVFPGHGVGCGAPVLGPVRGDGAPAQADRSGTARPLLKAHVTLTGDLGRSSPRSASLGPGLGRERRGRRCGLRSGLRGSQRDLPCHMSAVCPAPL